jgi:hypothetical protein
MGFSFLLLFITRLLVLLLLAIEKQVYEKLKKDFAFLFVH